MNYLADFSYDFSVGVQHLDVKVGFGLMVSCEVLVTRRNEPAHGSNSKIEESLKLRVACLQHYIF